MVERGEHFCKLSLCKCYHSYHIVTKSPAKKSCFFPFIVLYNMSQTQTEHTINHHPSIHVVNEISHQDTVTDHWNTLDHDHR